MCDEIAGPTSALLRPRNTALFEEMSRRWLAVGNAVSDLTGPRYEPQTSRSRDKRVIARPTVRKFCSPLLQLSLKLFFLTNFWFQEIERYNNLLVMMRRSLIDLEKGIQGLVLMSADLEETFQCIFEGRVPSMWEKVGGFWCLFN